MDRGAEVVAEAGEGEFCGPSPSADRLLRFQDEDGAPRLGERDGSCEAVRPRADDDRVERLVPDDLHEPAPVALAVELDEEHALPVAELQLAVTDRHRLAGAAEQHRHAV